MRKAFKTLCELSRDLVILVVPFVQNQHETEGYLDYWRFTPTCLRELFTSEGFEVIYEACNDDFNAATYLFVVGARDPLRWKGKMPPWNKIEVAGQWVGSSFLPLGSHVMVRVPSFLKRLLSRNQKKDTQGKHVE